jgi:hypothetical protein
MGNTAIIIWVMHVEPTVKMRYMFACVGTHAFMFKEKFTRSRSRSADGLKCVDEKSCYASEQSTAEGSVFVPTAWSLHACVLGCWWEQGRER